MKSTGPRPPELSDATRGLQRPGRTARPFFRPKCDGGHRLLFQSLLTMSNLVMTGRVNMSKFLLTVFAFGLLLSSAFAQEKSSEQYREEQSHIFGIEGLESQTFTRVVASGAKQRIDVYVSLNPDCSATGDINVRVTKQPEHGTVETVATTGYPIFQKKISALSAISTKLRARRSITRRQRNTPATMSLTSSSSIPADSPENFIST